MNEGLSYIQATLCVCSGIYSFLFAIITYFYADKKHNHPSIVRMKALSKAFLGVCILSFSDAFVTMGREGMIPSSKVLLASNFVCALMGLLVFWLLYYTLVEIITVYGRTPGKHWGYLMSGATLVGTVLLIINLFQPILYYYTNHNDFVRGSGHVLIVVIYGIELITLFAMTLYFGKIMRPSLFVTFAVLLLIAGFGGTLQVYVYNLPIEDIGLSLCMAVLFTIFQISKNKTLVEQYGQLEEYEQTLLEEQKEMEELSTRIVLSQLKPHFLYNALLSIQALIYIDRERAANAMESMLHLTRGVVDALENNRLVSFREELELTEAYLDMERIRFGDAIQYTANTEAGEFLLPPLTVLTLVENSVMHGIRKKDSGSGQIEIATYRRESQIYIQVKDDGIGWNTEKELDDDSHTGIRNVQKRLELLCKGTLSVESSPGNGATITIVLPGGINSNEHISC